MKFKKKALVLSCSMLLTVISPASYAQEVEWSIESGLGYETNVYHAPDHDYQDTSLQSYRDRPEGYLPVSPTEISSFFIPLETGVGIRNKVYDNADFVAEIDFETAKMLDSDADDATRTNVDLDLGLDFELVEWKPSKKKKDYIAKNRGDAYIGAFISSHNQVYVDRDFGIPKETTGGTDISDKYNYQSFGIKGDYERKVGKFEYMAGVVYEDLDYDKPQSGAEYDHEYNKYELGMKYDFNKATDLKLIYSYSVRDYSKRYARDLNGVYSSTNNDLLEYTYNAIELELRHRFNKKFKVYFKVKNSNRTDEYLGYNDYTRMNVSIRGRYKYSSKTIIRGKLKSTTIDYDRAYDFDDVNLNTIKESSGTDFEFKIEHQWHKHKIYYVELDYTDRVSTDDRYDYTNNMIMLGARWEY